MQHLELQITPTASSPQAKAVSGPLANIIFASSQNNFYQLSQYNSRMKNKEITLANGDGFQFRVGLDTNTIDTALIEKAKVIELTACYFHTTGPAAGRAYGDLPTIDSSYTFNDNLMTMITPTGDAKNIVNSSFNSNTITITTDASSNLTLEVIIMGLMSITPSGSSTPYYLPFSHDPIIVVNTGGGPGK